MQLDYLPLFVLQPLLKPLISDCKINVLVWLGLLLWIRLELE